MRNSHLFVSQLVSQEIIQRYSCSQAAFNFCRSVVATDFFDATYSVIPVQVRERLPKKDGNIKNIQIRFFPHRFRIFKAVNSILEGVLCALQCLKFEHIWFYNINKHLLLSALLLKFIFRKKVFVIVADFDFRPTSVFTSAWWCSFMVKAADGRICLSGRGLFDGLRNTKILPGIVPFDIDTELAGQTDKSTFLLSGSLVKSWGRDLAIDVFRANPQYILYISGILPSKELTEFKEKIEDVPNIRYLGFLSYEDYTKVLDDVSCCLSLRDPDAFENQNNFPSKIFEFLSKGKEVVSTMNYSELAGAKYTLSDFSREGLENAIKRVEALNSPDRKKRAQENKNWLEANVSANAWRSAFVKIEADA